MSNGSQPPAGKTSFFDLVVEKAYDLSSLTIHTVVGDFDIEPDKGTLKVLPKSGSSEQMFTRIDLIDGDITTALNSKFIESDYDEIRQLHMDREKSAKEIIRKNLETLEEVAKTVVKIMGLDPSKTGK